MTRHRRLLGLACVLALTESAFAQTFSTAVAVPAAAPGAAAAGARLSGGGASATAAPLSLSGAALTSPAGAPAVSPAAGAAPVSAPALAAPSGAPTALAAGARGGAPESTFSGQPGALAEGAPVQGPAPAAQQARSAAPVSEDGGPAAAPAPGAVFDGTGKAAAPKEWTFMVFLNGHNNLDRFGTLNMQQMEKVGSNDRVNLVVQWASLGKPTKRLLVQRSERGDVVASPVIEELPPVDMGDAAQLSEFIRWSVERFPAARYMVDVWNHGSGWRSRRAGFSPLDVSYDDQTGHHITTEQLGDVLRKAKALIGRPIDVLGFDACLMAMAEVAAEVADSVNYLAASEELEPGEGWPYDLVLKQWLAAPADDGAALVKALTEQFVKAYPRQVTFSGIDLRRFPEFAEAAKALSREIAALDAKGLEALRKAARETRRYGFNDYGDFLHFVLNASKPPAGTLSAASVERATRAFQAMLVAEAHSADRAGSHGLSAWLPTDAGLWRTYGKRYLGLAWQRLSEWAAVARKVAGAPEDPKLARR